MRTSCVLLHSFYRWPQYFLQQPVKLTMPSQLLFGVLLICLMHISIWWATNSQLMDGFSKNASFILAVVLSLPITLLSYYATRVLYEALNESLWSVRFIGFGVSYLVFPILTWYFLGESMFTTKTLLCILLSLLIIVIQVKM